MRLHNVVDQRRENVKAAVISLKKRLADLQYAFDSFEENDTARRIKDEFRSAEKLFEDIRHEVDCVVRFDRLED